MMEKSLWINAIEDNQREPHLEENIWKQQLTWQTHFNCDPLEPVAAQLIDFYSLFAASSSLQSRGNDKPETRRSL